ncbi:hypothetical protein ACN4EK_02050 [Pantanalinema rosaneae CENA516]|uniref:hypothetical protein n=1 Tax=Pantanalinema rosaneae TaxID=1620701 RepID=UPI003D6EE70C
MPLSAEEDERFLFLYLLLQNYVFAARLCLETATFHLNSITMLRNAVHDIATFTRYDRGSAA